MSFYMFLNGTQWYPVVPDATQWYMIVTNGTQWYRMVDGTQ